MSQQSDTAELIELLRKSTNAGELFSWFNMYLLNYLNSDNAVQLKRAEVFMIMNQPTQVIGMLAAVDLKARASTPSGADLICRQINDLDYDIEGRKAEIFNLKSEISDLSARREQLSIQLKNLTK